MRALVIVEPDTLTDSSPNLIKVAEAAIQTIFEFDNTVHPFGQSIVITIACGPHTGTPTGLTQPVSITPVSELHPAVAVVNEGPTSRRSLTQSLLQSQQRTVGGQTVTDVMTDNEPGIGIGNQGQVHVTDPSWYMFTKRKGKQDGKMAEKVIKRYSIAFKKQVVQEYEDGATIAQLQRKYGLSNGPTVKRWINQYSRAGVRHQVMHIQRPEEQEQVKELQKRLAEMEKLVAQLSLDKFMLESSLVVAEEELGYKLKKKAVTKSSTRRSDDGPQRRSK